MAWIEPVVLAIVALYVALQLRVDARPSRLLAQLGLFAAAGWATEESCIRLYGFYDYAGSWRVKLGHVPVLVALVWPVVIHSASRLAGALLPPALGRRPAYLGLATGLVVLTDAAFIEPLAVHAGLWRWTEPGIFHVPPIGLLGWAAFGGLCAAMGARALVLPVGLAGTHALLLATWWGALRALNHTVPEQLAASVAWAASGLLVVAAWRTRAGTRVEPHVLLARVPAAAFFFVLLALSWPAGAALPCYAAAFAPPYLLLTLQSCRRGA